MGLGDRDYYRPSGFGGFSFMPPVIKQLLIINGVVFFFTVIAENLVIGGMRLDNWIVKWFGLIPFGFRDALFLPWQLITYQFLHGGFMHIFFNMLMLWMFGMEIENLWGSKKFLIYYLLCGVGAGLFQLIIAPLFGSGLAPTVGASGAVYGVMLAFAMNFPDRYIFIYFLLPIKAKYLITILMVIEFMSVGDMSVVAHLAHIGGVVTGLAYILINRRKSIDLGRFVDSFKKSTGSTFSGTNKFRKPMGFGFGKNNVEDADFYEINNKSKKEDSGPDQDEIDRILDKISQSGYQNLTEREKRILFEASKRD